MGDRNDTVCTRKGYVPKTVYEMAAPERLKRYMDLSGIGIKDGETVLDVACGPASLGSMYGNVVGLDSDPNFIKRLRENGIEGVVADISYLPFRERSFDYVTVFGPPMIYLGSRRRVDTEKLIGDCLGIARKNVIVYSLPMWKNLPRTGREHIERMLDRDPLIVYRGKAESNDGRDKTR